MKKLFISLMLVASFSLTSSVSANHTTEHIIQQLQAQIQALLQQIQNLQTQGGGGSSTSFCHTFATNLSIGSSGSEVRALISILTREGFPANEDAEVGIFGEQTATAVVGFQAKYGILQTGYVGPITRAKLNQLYGCSSTPVISGVSGPQSLNVNQQGTWSVTASDSSTGTLRYSVVWGDEYQYQKSSSQGLSVPIASQQSAIFTHSYSQAGTYTPVFTATNSNAQSAQTSLSVNVGDTASVNNVPYIIRRPDTTKTVKTGEIVSFSWTAIDPDNDDLSWAVDWGEYKGGSTGIACSIYATQQNRANRSFSADHAYTSVGNYTVTAYVSDCRSGTNSQAHFNVHVEEISTTSNFTIITPSMLPNAKVGTNYSAFFGTSGNTNNDTEFWTVVNSSLPPEMFWYNQTSCNGACSLLGTFKSSGTYTFTLKVTAGSQNATKQFTLTVDPAISIPSSLLGDANMNGVITIGDALVVQLHVDGTTLLTGQALINADVNRSGAVTARDVTLIANYAGGLIKEFPFEKDLLTYSSPTSKSTTPNLASTIQAMMQSLRSISTQLDSLK